MTRATEIAREVEALGALDLEGVRALWRQRFGTWPRLRSHVVTS